MILPCRSGTDCVGISRGKRGGRGAPLRGGREKKCPLDIFSNFMSLRGTAHKGAQTPPLCELPAWKSFVGLALEGSNRQRFARIQIFRKKQGTVQSCPKRSFSRNSREGKLKCQFHLWLNEISVLPCDLLSEHCCLSEPLRASPPNTKPGIHKGAASEPLYAPSRAGT